MANVLRFSRGEVVRNIAVIARVDLDRRTGAAEQPRLGTRHIVYAAIVGELLAAVALLASGAVPTVLVRSLQLFLRF